MGYRLDGLASIPGRVEDFLFSIAAIPALGLTYLPIQLVLAAFSVRIKRPEREAKLSPTSCAEFKNDGAILPHTSSWHIT